MKFRLFLGFEHSSSIRFTKGLKYSQLREIVEISMWKLKKNDPEFAKDEIEC